MVLVDTSVWIAHFRDGNPALVKLLSDGLVLMHPSVAGELACGNLKNRTLILCDLAALPAATRASDAEVMRLVEDRRLWGRGLGWIDVHLLASALLSHCRLWTLDKPLGTAGSIRTAFGVSQAPLNLSQKLQATISLLSGTHGTNEI